MKRVGYICDVLDCEEPARVRFERFALPAPYTWPHGSVEMPPHSPRGLDLCERHAERAEISAGNFVVVMPGDSA